MLEFRRREDSVYAFADVGGLVGRVIPVEIPPARPSSRALTGQPSTWLRRTREQLADISSLSDDWDSYGARTISPSRIAQACILVQSIADERAPPPSLIPTPEGSIQLEWHSHGVELEVLLMSEADLGVSFEDLRGELPGYEEVLSYDVTPLVEYVHLLGERAQGSRDG